MNSPRLLIFKCSICAGVVSNFRFVMTAKQTLQTNIYIAVKIIKTAVICTVSVHVWSLPGQKEINSSRAHGGVW